MRYPLALAAAVLALDALAQSPVAALGKQRAAASPLQWEARESGHPQLGPIVFAFLKSPVVTPAGSLTIFSNVYLSCERSTAKIAIELANGKRVDDPGGLKARRMPELTCRSVFEGKASSEPIAARWTANEIGDVMTRGLWPSSLRTCAAIGVSEELELPAGSGRETARVEFEIPTYAREVDTVFARCGEPTAWPYVAAAPAAPPSSPPSAPPPSSPASAAPKAADAAPLAATPKAAHAAPLVAAPKAAAPATANGWISARVVTHGHTNVRARPSLQSPLVISLDPGDVVLVRKAEGDWWQARSRATARTAFEGYIRRDRLTFR